MNILGIRRFAVELKEKMTAQDKAAKEKRDAEAAKQESGGIVHQLHSKPSKARAGSFINFKVLRAAEPEKDPKKSEEIHKLMLDPKKPMTYEQARKKVNTTPKKASRNPYATDNADYDGEIWDAVAKSETEATISWSKFHPGSKLEFASNDNGGDLRVTYTITSAQGQQPITGTFDWDLTSGDEDMRLPNSGDYSDGVYNDLLEKGIKLGSNSFVNLKVLKAHEPGDEDYPTYEQEQQEQAIRDDIREAIAEENWTIADGEVNNEDDNEYLDSDGTLTEVGGKWVTEHTPAGEWMKDDSGPETEAVGQRGTLLVENDQGVWVPTAELLSMFPEFKGKVFQRNFAKQDFFEAAAEHPDRDQELKEELMNYKERWTQTVQQLKTKMEAGIAEAKTRGETYPYWVDQRRITNLEQRLRVLDAHLAKLGSTNSRVNYRLIISKYTQAGESATKVLQWMDNVKSTILPGYHSTVDSIKKNLTQGLLTAEKAIEMMAPLMENSMETQDVVFADPAESLSDYQGSPKQQQQSFQSSDDEAAEGGVDIGAEMSETELDEDAAKAQEIMQAEGLRPRGGSFLTRLLKLGVDDATGGELAALTDPAKVDEFVVKQKDKAKLNEETAAKATEFKAKLEEVKNKMAPLGGK